MTTMTMTMMMMMMTKMIIIIIIEIDEIVIGGATTIIAIQVAQREEPNPLILGIGELRKILIGL